MDLVSDFKNRIEDSTSMVMAHLNKTYKNILPQKKQFIKMINKYYTGLRVLFRYMSGEEKQEILLNNILLDMCSLLHCVVLGDVKLIYFLYRNMIESLLRYITKEYDSKTITPLFDSIDNGTTGKKQRILKKYKNQLKWIYTESCGYIHTNIKKIPKNIYDLKKYDTYIKKDLTTELKLFQRLCSLIICILRIKFSDKYKLLKSNSRAYINEIIPLENRVEYEEINTV